VGKLEDKLEEIVKLNGQDDEESFKKFLEAACIGRDSGDKHVHIMGLMNAASLACKMGNYDLCLKVATNARDVDEEIWIKYFEEPHMQEMLAVLSREGAFN